MSQEKQDQKRGVDTGEGPEEGQLPQGRNYLFIVGINHYNDKAIPRLQNAVKDAKKVLEILVDKYQFDIVVVFNKALLFE